MKKFFSLVLALVMALSLTTVAWADVVPTGDYTFTSNTVAFDTIDDMSYVGSSSSTPYPAWIHYEGSADITIDLGGLTFTMPTGTVHVPVYIGGSGTVTITNGKIIGSIDSRCIVAVGGTATVNFENVEIVSNRDNGSGVAIFQMKGFDTTVNLFDGAKISAVGSYATTESYGELNVYDGAVVSYDPTGSNGNGTGSAIGVSGGTGVANIYGGTISTNATGANKSAVSTNSSGGTINITGGTITGETAVFALTDSHYNNPAEINVSGGTINGALAKTAYGTASTEVTVSGGIFDRDVTTYLAIGYETAEVGSTGGTFVVGQDIEVDAGKITAGTFTDDVTDYLAAGFSIDAATGTVVAMPTAGVGKYDLYDQDGDLAEENITAEYTDSYEKKGAGNIGYWKLTVDGVTYSYYIECSRTKAEMYLTLADNTGVYKYLKHVEYVDYVATGKAYTNIGDDCGELDVGAKAKAYVLTDEDGNKTYWIADEDGDTVIMVGDELVLVSEVEDGLVPHAWVVTAYNDDEEPITAKCKECPATAKLYKTKLAAPVGATFAGQIAGYYVVVDGTTPSTDKVTSAETFDAGIALYVGMSVMAAAGSAVVIGKKKD